MLFNFIQKNKISQFERPFRKLTSEDKNWVNKILSEDGGIGCHLCFYTMLFHQELYAYDTFAEHWGCILKRPWAEGDVLHCHYPIGASENRKEAVRQIVSLYSPLYPKIEFFGTSEEGLKELQEMYPDKIKSFENDRDAQNYILDVQEQIKLEGSAFADRRNKIRRFNKLFSWSWEPITKENIDECIKINNEWCDGYGDDIVAKRGRIDMDLVIKYSDIIDFQGELYRVDGNPAAFSIGFPLNNEVYVNQIMKAKTEYRDITIAALHGFMQRNCAGYTYTNYTEDMGLPGLRKFKTMLHPKFMTDFYLITLDTSK